MTSEVAGCNIILRACRSPIINIVGNAGENGDVVANKVPESDNVNYGYDARKGRYRDLVKEGHHRPDEGRAFGTAERGERGDAADVGCGWSRICRRTTRRRSRPTAGDDMYGANIDWPRCRKRLGAFSLSAGRSSRLWTERPQVLGERQSTRLQKRLSAATHCRVIWQRQASLGPDWKYKPNRESKPIQLRVADRLFAAEVTALHTNTYNAPAVARDPSSTSGTIRRVLREVERLTTRKALFVGTITFRYEDLPAPFATTHSIGRMEELPKDAACEFIRSTQDLREIPVPLPRNSDRVGQAVCHVQIRWRAWGFARNSW